MVTTANPTKAQLAQQCAELTAAGYNCTTFSYFNSVQISATAVRDTDYQELLALRQKLSALDPCVQCSFDDELCQYHYDADGYLTNFNEQGKWLLCNSRLGYDNSTITQGSTGLIWQGKMDIGLGARTNQRVPMRFETIAGRIYMSAFQMDLPDNFTGELHANIDSVPLLFKKAYHLNALTLNQSALGTQFLNLMDIPLDWPGSTKMLSLSLPKSEPSYGSIAHLKMLLEKQIRVVLDANITPPSWLKLVNTHATYGDWDETLEAFENLTGQSYFHKPMPNINTWRLRYAAIRTEYNEILPNVKMATILLQKDDVSAIPEGAFPDPVNNFNAKDWDTLKSFANFPPYMNHCVASVYTPLDTWCSAAKSLVLNFPGAGPDIVEVRLPPKDLRIEHLTVDAMLDPDIQAVPYLLRSGMQITTSCYEGPFIRAYQNFCKTGDYLELAACYAEVYGQELSRSMLPGGEAVVEPLNMDTLSPLA